MLTVQQVQCSGWKFCHLSCCWKVFGHQRWRHKFCSQQWLTGFSTGGRRMADFTRGWWSSVLTNTELKGSRLQQLLCICTVFAQMLNTHRAARCCVLELKFIWLSPDIATLTWHIWLTEQKWISQSLIGSWSGCIWHLLDPLLFSSGLRTTCCCASQVLVQVGEQEPTVVATLAEGNYFGEISLLKLEDGCNRRNADVRSVGYSELLVLSKRDLNQVNFIICAITLRKQNKNHTTERIYFLQNSNWPTSSFPKVLITSNGKPVVSWKDNSPLPRHSSENEKNSLPQVPKFYVWQNIHLIQFFLCFFQALTEYPEARKALEKQARDRSVTLRLSLFNTRANPDLGSPTPAPRTSRHQLKREWFVCSHRCSVAHNFVKIFRLMFTQKRSCSQICTIRPDNT